MVNIFYFVTWLICFDIRSCFSKSNPNSDQNTQTPNHNPHPLIADLTNTTKTFQSDLFTVYLYENGKVRI